MAAANSARWPTQSRPGAVVALCLVQFVDVLGVTELVTALPSILRGFRAGTALAPLILTAYAMCFGGLLMLGARLGDRHGHRRTLLAGLGAFGLGSLIAALAPSPVVLIAGRCLQGGAAAMSVPATLALIAAATAAGDERNRALSLWSAGGATAGASGYLVGGVLTGVVGWRAVFWINVPAAGLLAAAVVARAPVVSGRRGRTLDIPGATLLTIGVMSIVLATTLLQSPSSRLTGAGVALVGMACLGALIAVERRAGDPLLSGALMRLSAVRDGTRAALENTASTSSVIALATLQLQSTEHVGPVGAGLRLMPFSVGAFLGARLAAPALRRLARRQVIALGLLVIAGGDVALCASPALAAVLPVAVLISGLGIGLSSVAATGLATDVEPGLRATAAAVANTAAQLGTAIGTAAVLLLTGLLADSALGGPQPGWVLAAIVAASGAIAAHRSLSASRAEGAARRA